MKRARYLRAMAKLAPLVVGCGLAACGGSSDKPGNAVAGSEDPSAPVALSPRRATIQSVALPVNPDEVKAAVDRLRAAKKRGESPFEQAGADLTGDGKAKALVLLTGADWCSPQGCTLVVFQPGDAGLRLVSQIVGVKPPVAVGAGSNAGWRDLIVKTGAGKIVRLQYTGGSYPISARSQPDASAEASQADILIPAGGGGQNLASAPVPPPSAQ